MAKRSAGCSWNSWVGGMQNKANKTPCSSDLGIQSSVKGHSLWLPSWHSLVSISFIRARDRPDHLAYRVAEKLLGGGAGPLCDRPEPRVSSASLDRRDRCVISSYMMANMSTGLLMEGDDTN